MRYRDRQLDGVSRPAIVVLLVAGAIASAADWPAYMHDNSRSGVTAERLGLRLLERWAFVPTYAPQPAWPEPTKEDPRVNFDYAYHVAIVGDALYFGSSADNKVYCLDASTGQVRWSFFTDGPVRLAPTVEGGRVFVGSDDGCAYCLDAGKGTLIWKFRAAPEANKLLGHGKMISLWPIRTGVLVDGGVAYFGAGIFPAEGVHLYAVRAEDGTLLWKNSDCGSPGSGGLTFQGYLLASPGRLFVPTGRNIPAAFDRKTGEKLHSRWHGWRRYGPVGGTYALLAGDHLYSGAGQVSTYDRKTGNVGFAWFPGKRLVVAGDTSYLLTGSEILALDRKTYPAASRKVLEAKAKWLDGDVNFTRMQVGRRMLLRKWQAKKRAELDACQSELRKGDKEASAGPTSKREALSLEVGLFEEAIEGVDKHLAHLERKSRSEGRDKEKEQREADALFGPTIKWRQACECADSMILTSDVLFAGGEGQAVAVRAADGQTLWTGKVSGRARGLAAAGGRLYVSSDDGTIHCFGKRTTAAASRMASAIDPTLYPKDKLTRLCEAAAERIVRGTGIKRGYGLVLGCRTGRLAIELAERTELMIYGVEPDAAKVEAARKAIDDAGLYGGRVCVEQGSLAHLPYSDYFANLIVCEDALLSGELPTPAPEVLRMLRPLGGVAYVGGPRVPPDRLREWLATLNREGCSVELINGSWARITRGPLKGAGSWGHQYAEPGNTACSDDGAVTCPIGPLWFGRPGPDIMCERHLSPAGPLSVNGRLFVQGDHVVVAHDAYNGLKLWERVIPGARRVAAHWACGNMVATPNLPVRGRTQTGSVFVAIRDTCLRLDAGTGETRQSYSVPPAADGKPRIWGYVASAHGLLFGSARAGRTSDLVFAFDIDAGKLRWAHGAKKISDISIAIGGGRVFFTDGTATPEQRKATLRGKPKRADVRIVVAIDAESGKTCWQKPVDLSDCGGGLLATIYRDNVLLFCGSYHNSHFYASMAKGELAHRRITALSALDGKVLWSRAGGYHRRPAVVGDTIYAEPWGYDIHTGEQKTRAHPLTGERVKWEIVRGGGCGMISACPSTCFFRSGATGYYDLARDVGTFHFGGLKPGCWINIIPANGIVLASEASAGCACLYPIRCTVAFKPRKTDRAWGIFSCAGAATPVKHAALNLGAPGDRRDRGGTLWLGCPRPPRWSFRPALKVNFRSDVLPGGGYFKHPYEPIQIQGASKPWLFTSGCEGLTGAKLQLARRGETPGVYTVRLYFADLTNTQAGQRVFDVVLGRRVVMEDLDIVKEAGGRNRAIVKEFEGIEVKNGDLVIELVPKVANPTRDQFPLINAIEVMRTGTLEVTAPQVPAQFAGKVPRDFPHPPKYIGVIALEPAYTRFLFSRATLAHWLKGLSQSSLAKRHGIEVRRLKTVDEILRACRTQTRDFFMIVNAHGEDFPSTGRREWRRTVDAIRHYVEHGGIWWETGGYCFWRTFFPRAEQGKVVGWDTEHVGEAGLDWLFGLRCKTLPWKSPASNLRPTRRALEWLGQDFASVLSGKKAIVTRSPPETDYEVALVESNNGPYIVGYQLSGWGWFFRVGGWGNPEVVIPTAVRAGEYLYTHEAKIHSRE